MIRNLGQTDRILRLIAGLVIAAIAWAYGAGWPVLGPVLWVVAAVLLLTAAFATALGAAGISANVIAGFYHDHIFVGLADGERAMSVLRQLARDAGAIDTPDVDVGRED